MSAQKSRREPRKSDMRKEQGRPETSVPAARRGIAANLPTISLLVLVLFFLFTSRIVYAPLLLSLEESLGLSHARAASFFLFITIGYGSLMLFSGFVAARLGHRTTILLALLVTVAALAVVASSRSLWGMRAGLILLGMGSGLYFPSGIPTLVSLVEDRDAGKALAMHELGPNLSFVLTPIAAVLLLRFVSWRIILLLLGGFGIAVWLLFLLFAKGGRFHGKPPHLANARLILPRPSFWILAGLFALGAGAGIGIFSMTPTYLIAERAMDPELVNTLVGLARVASLAMVFLAGYLADRYGIQRILSAVLLLSGLATAILGVAFKPVLIAAVFAQPVLIASFFPVAFVAISRIAPQRLYNLTISFMLPMVYTVGYGLVPYFLGLLGDRASFATGFYIYGGLLVCAAGFPFLLRLRQLGGSAS